MSTPPVAWVWTPRGTVALLLAWGAGHALLRLALSSALTIDDAREAVLAQSLEWGYQARQPPLYNWLVWAAFRLLGPGLLALTVVKYAVLVLAFAFVHLTARRALADPRLATLAAFSFLLVVPISWTVHEALTHSVAVLAACAGTVYALVRLHARPSAGAYAALGLAVGLGVLSKFTYGVFLVAVALAALSLAPFRARLLSRRLAIAGGVAALLVLPVAAWYVQQGHDLGELYAVEVRIARDAGWAREAGAGLYYLARMALYYLGPLAAVLAACAPEAYRRLGPAPPDGAAGRLLGRLVVAVLALLAATALAGLLGYLKFRWLIPAFSLAPLYALWRLERAGGGPRRLRALVLVLVAAEAAVAIGFAGRVLAAGLFPRPSRLNEPYDAVAAELRRAGFTGGTIVGGLGSLAGNLAIRFPDARVLYVEYPAYRPPARGRGQCLVAWEPRGSRRTAAPQVPDDLRALARSLGVRLTGVEPVRTIEVPYRLAARHLRRVDFLLFPDGAGRCR